MPSIPLISMSDPESPNLGPTWPVEWYGFTHRPLRQQTKASNTLYLSNLDVESSLIRMTDFESIPEALTLCIYSIRMWKAVRIGRQP
jgi:hypothetical protein